MIAKILQLFGLTQHKLKKSVKHGLLSWKMRNFAVCYD